MYVYLGHKPMLQKTQHHNGLKITLKWIWMIADEYIIKAESHGAILTSHVLRACPNNNTKHIKKTTVSASRIIDSLRSMVFYIFMSHGIPRFVYEHGLNRSEKAGPCYESWFSWVVILVDNPGLFYYAAWFADVHKQSVLFCIMMHPDASHCIMMHY